jgi:hypothetical protein
LSGIPSSKHIALHLYVFLELKTRLQNQRITTNLKCVAQVTVIQQCLLHALRSVTSEASLGYCETHEPQCFVLRLLALRQPIHGFKEELGCLLHQDIGVALPRRIDIRIR